MMIAIFVVIVSSTIITNCYINDVTYLALVRILAIFLFL